MNLPLEVNTVLANLEQRGYYVGGISPHVQHGIVRVVVRWDGMVNEEEGILLRETRLEMTDARDYLHYCAAVFGNDQWRVLAALDKLGWNLACTFLDRVNDRWYDVTID